MCIIGLVQTIIEPIASGLANSGALKHSCALGTLQFHCLIDPLYIILFRASAINVIDKNFKAIMNLNSNFMNESVKLYERSRTILTRKTVLPYQSAPSNAYICEY